jgi:glycosyltransferase involved in cell wall biosynthesis
MRQLGIAILIHNIDLTGGMEKQALQLAEELARRGARVWIFSGCHVVGSFPRLPRGIPAVERRGRLTIYRVPMCTGWMWRTSTSLFELVVAGILAARAPHLDAIYAVQWTMAVHASRVARFLDCPLFVKFAGGGYYGDFMTLGRSPEQAPTLAALARAERLVCISPQIVDEVRAAGLPAERICRIPNGVNLSRFEGRHSAALPLVGDPEYVLYVGGLRREKRVPELVHTFAEVARTRPRAQLVIVGDGPEDSAVRAAAREAGIEARVHLLGIRTDVPDLLAAAHVFVLTSTSEGLSNSLLEALAAGVPIVATDIEGNRAVVEHEKDALLVPLGDSAALASAMARLLEDRELATRLARAGREKVRQYGLGEVALKYEGAFREVARPLPSSLRLMGRYWRHFESLGLSGLALVTGRLYMRNAVTALVVSAKRALGIEGEILGWRRKDNTVARS